MRVVYIIENAYIVISFADRAVGAAWPVVDEMGKLTHFVCFLLCGGGFRLTLSPFHSTPLEETELSASLCSLVSCWDSHYYSIVQALLLMIEKNDSRSIYPGQGDLSPLTFSSSLKHTDVPPSLRIPTSASAYRLCAFAPSSPSPLLLNFPLS